MTYQELVEQRPVYAAPISDKELFDKIAESYDAIIVLDDDPTGTQTVHDTPILTEHTLEALEKEFKAETALFYILTNSRSLDEDAAKILGIEIATNIKKVASRRNKKCLIISRSDSTLRGHYPLEVNLLTAIFQPKKPVHFLVPAFFEGGRYTIDDIHYVREGEQLLPAAETPFAKDKVFGYYASNLKEWVLEKYRGSITPQKVHSLSLDEIENTSINELIARIDTFQPNDVCILNAISYDHLRVAIYAILSSSLTPFFRSAASLVAAFALQSPKILTNSELAITSKKGGVSVLGSYVPKSTSQLEHVLKNVNIKAIEVDVASLLEGTQAPAVSIAKKIDLLVEKGEDVIIYTSRKLINVAETSKNLQIGAKVSHYLTTIISSLCCSPRYVLGKGGITSSDLATKSLGIKRAMILGQLLPGVPVWKTLEESKFPGIPYIVFPGNVGDDGSLTEILKKLQ